MKSMVSTTLKKVVIMGSVLAFTSGAWAQAAKSAPAKKAEAAKVEAIETKTINVSGGIKWTGYGVGKSHTGDLTLKSGTITVAGENITGGEFIFDMTTIAYPNKRLEGHLKSADFFDVTKKGFETATFKITKVEAIKPETKAGGAAQPTHKIMGDLTIKGKTNPIEFSAVVSRDGQTWKASGDAEIKDRTAFDIKYNSTKFASIAQLADKAIEDRITIKIDVVTK